MLLKQAQLLPVTGPLHLLLPLSGKLCTHSHSTNIYWTLCVCHFLIDSGLYSNVTASARPFLTTHNYASTSCQITQTPLALFFFTAQPELASMRACTCHFAIYLLSIFPTKMWALLGQGFILFPAIFPLIEQSLGWVGTQCVFVTCMNKLSSYYVPSVLLTLSHLIFTISAALSSFYKWRNWGWVEMMFHTKGESNK